MTTPRETDLRQVPVTGVVGGSHGLAVDRDRARALAASFDTAGNRMRGWAGTGGRVVRNGDLLESALLSPGSFADAELAVLGATTGPDGILVESLGWETDALLVRATVTAFERTDQAVAAAFEVVDYAVGRAAGTVAGAAIPVLLPRALVVGLLGYAAYSALPGPLQRDVTDVAGRGAGALQDWLADHPGVVEHAANGGGGLIDGFWSGLTGPPLPGPHGLVLHPTTEDAAGLLAGLYAEDGSAAVSARHDLAPHGLAPDGSARAPGAPASVAEMLAHLRRISLLSGDPDSPHNGTIEVQTFTGPDGPRHVVYLPGTDDMLTLPVGPTGRDGDVRDMPTNLLAVSGASTTYADGVLEAMRRAGVRPDEPVALVGHSQGGIVAAWLAAHQETYEIDSVVTAGSPVGGLGPYPDGTHLLSLENHGDVVPLVEGEANPDTGQHLTVTFDHRGDDLVDSHDLRRYVAGGAAVDASGHPSVVAELARLRTLGFLADDGAGSRTQVFQITRS